MEDGEDIDVRTGKIALDGWARSTLDLIPVATMNQTTQH